MTTTTTNKADDKLPVTADTQPAPAPAIKKAVYQERLAEEKKDLDARLEKLQFFIDPKNDTEFMYLDIDMKTLLQMQEKAMVELSKILERRVALS